MLESTLGYWEEIRFHMEFWRSPDLVSSTSSHLKSAGQWRKSKSYVRSFLCNFSNGSARTGLQNDIWHNSSSNAKFNYLFGMNVTVDKSMR